MDIVTKGQGYQTHNFRGKGSEKETSDGAVDVLQFPPLLDLLLFLPRKIIVDMHDNEMAGWKYLAHIQRGTDG
jgi:hypothetical protein